jgi:Ca2+:H+ antiporter
MGMTSIFIGVIVVAIIGNAAEHSTAVIVALKNRMDLSLGIAIGSSIQVALFVAPCLVFCSYFIGPAPMDLVFTPVELVSIGLAALITEQITGDGESNWLEGIQLNSIPSSINTMNGLFVILQTGTLSCTFVHQSDHSTIIYP